ncbi:hypothetical protein PBAL39_14204 [Pedobacter sp. BAL39]|uniref:NfeD family protein n=1 Tax=Pedobacter sp. BAL39 TaxID=391596 RepID=UPI000155AC4B|nr:NfeD family protein [Pedobacter sp. BAL39]EDM34716.1 hypothetical protein PBAL39_14204 [Pedobacter sp. BAL39]
MDKLLDNALIWFCLGFAFFLLEFLVPGFILFFFGVGAWIVALVAFFTDVSLNTQIILFILSSLLTVVFFRSWVKRKLGMGNTAGQQLEDEFIGKVALAETVIGPGNNGKVEFKGASWEASSEQDIAAGERVIITGNRSILLIVKSTK